jgi:hypothetical protein
MGSLYRPMRKTGKPSTRYWVKSRPLGPREHDGTALPREEPTIDDLWRHGRTAGR